MCRHVARRRSFVVHHLAARRTAHDLHRVVMVTVSANGDAPDAGGATRKECRLPTTQPVLVKGLDVRRRRVIDDGHQAVNVAVGRPRCGQAQTAHHGRANGVHGQQFPFDCGCGHHFLGGGVQCDLARRREPDGCCFALDDTVHAIGGSQIAGDCPGIEREVRPRGATPDPEGLNSHEPYSNKFGSHYESYLKELASH